MRKKDQSKNQNDETKNGWSNEIGPLYQHEGHKKPVTRREFFAQSSKAVATSVLMPSLLSMISQRAYGQSTCGLNTELSSMIPVFQYDAAGGAAWANDIVVGGMGGQNDFLRGPKAYENYGIPDDLNYNQAAITPDENFGLLFHPDSAFLAGLKSALPMQYWNSVSGFSVANRSGSDTDTNHLSPIHYFSKFGHSGALTNVAGSSTAAGGGRHRAARGSISSSSMPVLVNSAATARSIAGAGRIANINVLGQAKAQRVIEAMQKMSSSQIQRFTGLSFHQQLQALQDCGLLSSLELHYLNSVELPFVQTADQIFPANGVAGGDTTLQQAFSVTDGDTTRLAAMAKLLMDRNVGVGVFTRGGYDNHNGTSRDPMTVRCRAGFRIGQMIHYAALRQSPLYVVVTTDGGMGVTRVGGVVQTDDSAMSGSLADPLNGNFSYGGRGHIQRPGDSDVTALQFALVFIPGKTRSEINQGDERQVGAFTTGGVNQNYLITSNDTTNVAKLMAYNWLALHGKETEFRSVVDAGRHVFGGPDEAAYLKFKKVV